MAETPSTNFFTDNEDLKFQLSRIDWDTLVRVTEGGFADPDAFKSALEARASYEEILLMLGEFVAKEVAPHTRELDEQHPTLKDGEVTDGARMKTILNGLAELGAMGLTLPRRLGGMNAPLLVNSAFVEMLARADTAVVGEFGFFGGIAQALVFYSLEEGSVEHDDKGFPTKTRFDDVARKIGAGEEWGAMVLTEPGAGSDLAQLKAKAVLAKDGKSWRVTGQKIFITAGHGQHHIVIARSEDEKTHAGLKGLSLFYVPAHKDGKRNFEIGGVEHKMGQHSAVAATIHYEDSYAELIGQRGHGFLGMLLLMNNARLAVGFESIGIMEAAYRMARAYAEERVSMGKAIARHEMIADYLDEMEVTIKGLRAITFEAAFHEEVSTRMKASLKARPIANDDERKKVEREIRRHKRRARHLTPLIKYLGGEEAVRCARMNMQILGGIGYITETGAEKILRDALVLPVYEGTSQIQSLMAMKDNLQAALRNPGRFLGEMASSRIDSLSGKDVLDKGVARLKSYSNTAMQTIMTRIAADKLGDMRDRPLLEWKSAFMQDWNPARDFSFGLLHAERLTKLLINATVAETLVRQAHETKGTPHHEDRKELALRWIERMEPRSKGLLGEIEATGGSLVGRVLAKKKGASTKDEVEAA